MRICRFFASSALLLCYISIATSPAVAHTCIFSPFILVGRFDGIAPHRIDICVNRANATANSHRIVKHSTCRSLYMDGVEVSIVAENRLAWMSWWWERKAEIDDRNALVDSRFEFTERKKNYIHRCNLVPRKQLNVNGFLSILLIYWHRRERSHRAVHSILLKRSIVCTRLRTHIIQMVKCNEPESCTLWIYV